MDKIFVDEAVNELQTIQDMLRWSVSRFSAANIWYGHGTDNPWDEAVQLVLPSLYLPLDIPEDMRTARLTSSEKHRIVERVIRRVNERIPVAYLTNRAWFCGHEFYVDERVLVPRSPIGELINNKFAGLISKQPQHILDMCTSDERFTAGETASGGNAAGGPGTCDRCSIRNHGDHKSNAGI